MAATFVALGGLLLQNRHFRTERAERLAVEAELAHLRKSDQARKVSAHLTGGGTAPVLLTVINANDVMITAFEAVAIATYPEGGEWKGTFYPRSTVMVVNPGVSTAQLVRPAQGEHLVPARSRFQRRQRRSLSQVRYGRASRGATRLHLAVGPRREVAGRSTALGQIVVCSGLHGLPSGRGSRRSPDLPPSFRSSGWWLQELEGSTSSFSASLPPTSESSSGPSWQTAR
jgi:hypothetical protein